MRHIRAGFTLIELLVVVVLGSIVLMAAMSILITNQRIYSANAATVIGQQNTRMSADILNAELREISASGGDILSMSATALEVRIMRKFSVTCATDFTGNPPVLTVLSTIPAAGALTAPMNLMAGVNSFAVGDRVMVYADNDPGDPDDDVWIPATVDAVAVATCEGFGGDPGDNSDDVAAVAMSFQGQQNDFAEDLSDPQGDFVDIGAPVRSFVTYTFGTLDRGGQPYLARREGAGAWIPMVGPLLATNGLGFVYRDADGTVTATAADVRQIEVTVRTASNVLNSLGEMVSDSITILIYTRG